MVFQPLGHPLGIVDMTLDPQAERLQPLEEQERIEWGQAAAKITQDLHARFEDKGRRTKGGIDQAVIGVIGRIEVREARIASPLKVSTVDDNAAD